MNAIMKIVKPVDDASILIKDVSRTAQNEAKGQKSGFLGMLPGTIGTSLLENLLTVKGVFWLVKDQLEQVTVLLEHVRVFNVTSFFN